MRDELVEAYGVAVKKPKLKKMDAVAALADLAERIPEADMQIVADLMSYFRPTAPKVAKTPWQWACKFVGKQDSRIHLNYVYIDEENVVASNGHFLALVPKSSIPDCPASGFYHADATVAKVDLAVRYPDYRQIVSTLTQGPGETVSLSQVSDKMPLPREGALQEIRYVGSAAVNAAYFDTAINGDADPEITVYGKEAGVVVKQQFGTALIMPIRV